jgi:hypothetical protein
MREELVSFILQHQLSPFSEEKAASSNSVESILKTKDAKAVYTRVLNQVSSHFTFTQTEYLLSLFGFTQKESEIIKRQNFSASLVAKDRSFLKSLRNPRKTWKPKYDIIAVTEDEATLVKLKELGCPSLFLVSEQDCLDLERYDVVQVINCDQFQLLLERLPQSIFLNSLDDVYLERYLEEISGWKENYEVLKNQEHQLSEPLRMLLQRVSDVLSLLDEGKQSRVSEAQVECVVEEINEKISTQIKAMTISGEGLLKMLGEGKMPPAILDVVRKAIDESGLSEQLSATPRHD